MTSNRFKYNLFGDRLTTMDPIIDKMPDDTYYDTDPYFAEVLSDEEELLDGMRINRNNLVNSLNSICWLVQRGQYRSAMTIYYELFREDDNGLVFSMKRVLKQLLGFDPETDAEARKNVKDQWEESDYDENPEGWLDRTID